MAHIYQTYNSVRISPPPPDGTEVTATYSFKPLEQSGLNIPVTISAASSMKKTSLNAQTKAVTVMAHFDTGASRTSIDTTLAEYIGLIPVGISPVQTAAGLAQMPNFVVDISFPNSKLQPFINLPISSCKLPFKIGESGLIETTPQNFGILLGRDIMARWNIVWNGPTSTVIISD